MFFHFNNRKLDIPLTLFENVYNKMFILRFYSLDTLQSKYYSSVFLGGQALCSMHNYWTDNCTFVHSMRTLVLSSSSFGAWKHLFPIFIGRWIYARRCHYCAEISRETEREIEILKMFFRVCVSLTKYWPPPPPLTYHQTRIKSSQGL